MKKVRDGYKMTELGEIPQEWQINSMKDITISTQLGTNTLGKDEIGVPMLKMGNLTIGGFNFDKIEYIKAEELVENKEFLLKKGDFLFNTRNTLELVGKSAVWNEQMKSAIFNSNIMRIKYCDKINDFYMGYYFSSNIGWKELKAISTGTTSVAAIYTKDLMKVKVIVPSLLEQEKIASILSTVDEQIDNVDGLIEKNKELKTGLMQQLLTKGIGHTKFKKTEIGEIPEEWEVEYLDNVATRYSGHTPNKQKNEYWNGDIPWISLKDTKKLDNLYIKETEDYTTELGIENSSAVKLPKGTVVISRDATVGKVGITKLEYMATSQHFINYVCSNRLHNLFLYYYLFNKKALFERVGIGSTIKTIGLPFFKELKITLPLIEEQEKIASILVKIDEEMEEYENKKKKLQELKKGLMQQLLTGSIRVK